MDLTAWLIILLVVGFLASTLSSIIPSPRQRQVGKLRQHAYQIGLQVKSRPGNGPTVPAGVYYWLPWPPDIKKQRPATFVVDVQGKVLDGTLASELLSRFKPLLGSLPEGVHYLESFPEGLAVHWREGESDNDVEHIRESLATMLEIMQSMVKSANG